MAVVNVAPLVEKLGLLIAQEVSLFGEVDGQVRLLRNELEWMRLVVEDADIDKKCDEDKGLKLWVNQIRNVAYDAEDVVDEFMFEIQHLRQRRRNGFLPTWMALPVKRFQFIHKLDSRIREINITLGKILDNKSRYKIENGSAIPSEAGSSSSTEEVMLQREKRVPVVEEAEVVGMTSEEKEVKKMLVEGEMERGVVAIVGLGGLGKTTLAKKVYNDSDVNQNFGCRALVYVSQDFRIRKLLMGIAYSVMNLSKKEKNEMRKMRESELGQMVSNHLRRMRYLIVLDDVWTTKAWEELSSYFPSANRSRVLITTRNEDIAIDANSRVFKLHPLDEADSWKLFLGKTFPSVRNTSPAARLEGLGWRKLFLKLIDLEWKKLFLPVGSTSPADCPAELEDLGKNITEKCKGLPLAIVVLGGLLSRKEKTQSSWKNILESMEWHLSQGPESCLRILALSYNSLPYFLKSCFLYCSVFPKDHEIKANKLIQMWIVEGFVQIRGEETAEEVAEDYLEELIHRSMIQVARRKSDGRVKSFRIHDLLHDLAVSKAKDSKIFEVQQNINLTSPFNPRRLIAHDYKSGSQLLHGRGLRSLICSIDAPKVSLIIDLAKVLKSLRTKLLTVLDLSLPQYSKDLNLPKEIGEFIHLKYFSLNYMYGDINFPKSIVKLANLQVLDLRGTSALIPCSIWKLHQLRHLYISIGDLSHRKMGMCSNSHLGLNEMTNLQTLYLRPNAWLESCGLEKLTQLRKLYLCDKILFKDLDRLYPLNLVQLKLEYCELEQDPMFTLYSLPKLRVLKLMSRAYIGDKMICHSHWFPRLEFLRLHYLDKLKELKVMKGAMPSLKTLQIIACDKMETLLPELLNLNLRNLQQVKLQRMRNRNLMQEIQNSGGEESDQIRHIISIIQD